MSAQPRYQIGVLEKRPLASGPTWYLRYWRVQPNGQKRRMRKRLGLVSDLPSENAARRAARVFLDEINGPEHRDYTMTDVIQRYIREEMPSRYATAENYRRMMRTHIDPRWGREPIAKIKAQAVRRWLLDLPFASRTKGHLHGMLRILFKFAMLWEWLPLAVNPMSLFAIPGATKKTRRTRTLTVEQIHAILEGCPEFVRLPVLVAACTGLRRSEIFGLQWGDFDWLEAKVRVSRSVVDGRCNAVKTIYSEASLPLHPMLVAKLREHLSELPENARRADGWVFGNPNFGYAKPHEPRNLQQRFLRRAGGSELSVGWHTFRHTYKTMMRQNGTPLEIQRDLMRHADIRMTVEYGTPEDGGMRQANTAVVERLMRQ